MTDVLDLDKLIEDKREIKLAGKKIDVSKIPSKVSLKVADIYDELDEDDPGSFDKILDLVMEIIESQNEDISKDWLIENASMRQLIALIDFVMKPINERKEDDSKN